MPNNSLQVRYFGDRALLIFVDNQSSIQSQIALLKEVIPEASIRAGLKSIILEFPKPTRKLLALKSEVLSLLSQPRPERAISSARTVEIDVAYIGEDLDELAILLGCSKEYLITSHSQITWEVALIGFAPGMPYLIPKERSAAAHLFDQLPRKYNPRTRVPAGSVAVAVGMSIIYPTAMPGGWHLIGKTQIQLFDSTDNSPSRLVPGDLVRFKDRTK